MPKDKTLLRPVGDTAGGEAGERVNGAISQSRSEKQLLATTPNNTPRNHSLESIKARSTGQSADSRSHTVDRDLLSGHQKLTDTANSRASLLSSGRSAKELRKTVSRGFSIERSPPVRSSFTAKITDPHHLKGRKDPIPEQGSNRPKTAPSSSAKKEISSAEQDRKIFLNFISPNIFGEVLEEGRDIEFQTLIEKLSEFKKRLDSVPAGITEEYSTLKEQRETITRQTSEISLLQAQANSSIEANELTQKELTDLANRLGMNGYSEGQTTVNATVTAQEVSNKVNSIIERINSLKPVLDELAFEIDPTLKRKELVNEDLTEEAEDNGLIEDDESFKSRILYRLAENRESLLMAGEDFNADVKKTKELSTQTDRPLDQFSTQPATPPDYSEILGSICAVVVDLKDTLKNLNLVAEERWSEAREVASEDLERQGKRESRRKEKDLLKKEEKEAEAERRREDEQKNTKRDQFINDLREEFAQLKLEMEQEKKTAVDVLKAEKAEREKAAEAARNTKEKEDKEKAVKDAKDEKAAKEKAAEDAKGPLQKFYDALEVQINKNPGRTILTPSGVSLKDLKDMGIDPGSLPGSIIPTAADKKNR